MIAAALDAGADFEALYVAPPAADAESGRALVARAKDAHVAIFDLAPGVIEKVADSRTPQPLIATIKKASRSLDDITGEDTLVVLVDVRDPGNLGAILRVADATGVGGVVACAGCADWRSPKAVRASAGSCFSVPVVDGDEPPAVLAALRASGFVAIGTAASGGSDPTDFAFPKKVAFVLGNEASGLTAQLGSTLDASVSIPMAGSTESLNVATAAAVICYERVRQEKHRRNDVVR